MDEILYLDADDEITLVIEKLHGLEGESVSLVVPKGSQILGSVVNLKLIQKEAKKLKKKLAIVTQDKVGGYLANQLGIPVYNSLGDDLPISISEEPTPNITQTIEFEEAKAKSDDAPKGINVTRYDDAKDVDRPQQGRTQDSSSTMNRNQPHQASRVHQSKSMQPNSSINRTKLLTSSIILLLLALGLGWWLIFIYPSATVFLSLESSPITQQAQVVVDNNITKADDGIGHIPGQKVQAEVSLKETFPATGEKEVGTKATGTIIASNRLGQSVDLPSGTVFTTGSLNFLSTAAVSVPAATASLDSQGEVVVKPGTVNVPVEAEKAGDGHNIGPSKFTITSLSGVKKDKVTGESTTSMTGGESKKIKILAQADIDAAKEEVINRSKENLIIKLKEENQHLTMISDTYEFQVLEATPNKQVDEETEEFELDAKVQAKTIGFDSTAYQDMVVVLVEKNIDSGRKLVVTKEDSIESKVQSKDYSQGILTLNATLRSETVPNINEEELKKLVAGKSFVDAKNLLEEQVEINSARIDITPNFKEKLPGNFQKVKIMIERQ